MIHRHSGLQLVMSSELKIITSLLPRTTVGGKINYHRLQSCSRHHPTRESRRRLSEARVRPGPCRIPFLFSQKASRVFPSETSPRSRSSFLSPETPIFPTLHCPAVHRIPPHPQASTMRNLLRLRQAISSSSSPALRCWSLRPQQQLTSTTPSSLRVLSTYYKPSSSSPSPNSVYHHHHHQSQYTSYLSKSRNTKQLQINSSRFSPKSFVRYCSHRRMCQGRGLDADVPAGSVDVTQGREILPANVKPTNYNLTLEPDLEKFTFEGTVEIEWVPFESYNVGCD